MISHLQALATGVLLLGFLGGIAAPAPARTAHAELYAAAGPRLSVTPGRVLPGPHIHAIVHLRGVPAGSPVEVQISPPPPSIGTLVDLHTRASATGTVDQPVSFSAVPSGSYVVFVNLGAYADSHSPIPGSSLQTTLLVSATVPFISFPCGAPLQATVKCQLTGYGFYPRERVSITYDVSIDTLKGGRTRTIYRRTASTDARGMLTRPVFSFKVDPRVESYRVTVTAIGARGDRATVGSVGIAQ